MARRYIYDWEKVRAAFEEECRNKRISGQMLAQEMGITQSLYSMFLRGARKSLGRDSLQKVCDYFEVPHEHWLKEAPVEQEKKLVEKFQAVLSESEKLNVRKQGILELLKEQIENLYKDIK